MELIILTRLFLLLLIEPFISLILTMRLPYKLGRSQQIGMFIKHVLILESANDQNECENTYNQFHHTRSQRAKYHSSSVILLAQSIFFLFRLREMCKHLATSAFVDQKRKQNLFTSSSAFCIFGWRSAPVFPFLPILIELSSCETSL